MKQYLANIKGYQASKIYHVTVEPCYDKKLEASRSDFYSEHEDSHDVDCVITSRKYVQSNLLGSFGSVEVLYNLVFILF